MRWWLVVLFACGSPKHHPDGSVHLDAGDFEGFEGTDRCFCDVFFGTGCTVGEKCTWVIDDPTVQKRLADSALEPMHDSPEQFAARIKRDNAKFAAIIQKAGLKPE